MIWLVMWGKCLIRTTYDRLKTYRSQLFCDHAFNLETWGTSRGQRRVHSCTKCRYEFSRYQPW